MFKLILISLIELFVLFQFGSCLYCGCRDDPYPPLRPCLSCPPRPYPTLPPPYRPYCQTTKPPNYCDEISIPLPPKHDPICFSEKLLPKLQYKLALAQRFDQLQRNFFCRQCERLGTCPKGSPVPCSCLS